MIKYFILSLSLLGDDVHRLYDDRRVESAKKKPKDKTPKDNTGAATNSTDSTDSSMRA